MYKWIELTMKTKSKPKEPDGSDKRSRLTATTAMIIAITATTTAIMIITIMIMIIAIDSYYSFSYWLGQAGIVHIGLDQRVLTVVCEIRERISSNNGYAGDFPPASAAPGADDAGRDAPALLLLLLIICYY